MIEHSKFIRNILILILVLLSLDMPFLKANSVEPDQLASSEANWSGSALFVFKYSKLVGSLMDLFKW